MVPDDKSIPLYDGIRMVIRLMKDEGFPLYFTPGVIHLPTVPAYRKANKMDMGTADKVCCVALAIREQAKHYGIDYSATSFILAEVDYAFNAVIGVEDRKIVDGFGGTSGGPGFITLGSMDSELAVRLGKFPGIVLLSGGAKDASGKDDLTPEELAKEHHRLSQFGKVWRVGRQARVAKEAAEGAYIIGEGLLGGKYKGIVDSMQLRQASGTMHDYILLKGIKLEKS